MKIVCFYVKSNDDELVADSLFCLCNLSDFKEFQDNYIRLVIDMGVVPIILSLQNLEKIGLLHKTIQFIGNLLTGNDYIIDEMLKYNVIDYIIKIIKYNNPSLKQKGLWALSNIAAGTKSQILSILETEALTVAMELIKEKETEVSREAVWTMCNCITGADWELTVRLIRLGAMDAIIYVIVNIPDANVLSIILESLKKLFELGDEIGDIYDGNNTFVSIFIKQGGLDPLDRLQSHPSNDVYNSANYLIEKYFLIKN